MLQGTITAEVNSILGPNPSPSAFNTLYNELYTGALDADANAITQLRDGAEAGGILKSSIGKLTISGHVTNTSPINGQFSGAVAASGIGSISTQSQSSNALTTRVYGDPAGSPTVDQYVKVNDNEFDIILSEPINTTSLNASKDNDGDGSVTGPSDVQGTVTVTDSSGNVYNDVQLVYTTQTDPTGTVHGVIQVIRAGGFVNGADVTLSGSLTGAPAVYDRSGLRSSLRSFGPTGGLFLPNQPDVFGTILDGNNDGIEGGDSAASVFVADAPDDRSSRPSTRRPCRWPSMAGVSRSSTRSTPPPTSTSTVSPATPTSSSA